VNRVTTYWSSNCLENTRRLVNRGNPYDWTASNKLLFCYSWRSTKQKLTAQTYRSMKTAADGWVWMKYLVLCSYFSNWKCVFYRYYTGWSVCCQYHASVPAHNMAASSMYIFIPHKIGPDHSSGSWLPASHRGSPGSILGQVVGFVVGEVALGQVFSKYFGFPCQFSFHWLLHTHHHLLSKAGTKGQILADIPSGLNLTPTN
jgi:hypothetical protein